MIASFIPSDNQSESKNWQYRIIQHINQSDIQIDVEPSAMDKYIKDIADACVITHQEALENLANGSSILIAYDKVMETHVSFSGDYYLELIYQSIIQHHLEVADKYNYPSIEFSAFVYSLKRDLEKEYGLDKVLNHEISEDDIFSFILNRLNS